MGSLRVDYNSLGTLSQKIDSQANEFDSCLNKIRETNEELKSYWEGADAQKYTGAVDTQAQTMAELAKTIHDISAFLMNVKNAYEKTCEENASAISG